MAKLRQILLLVCSIAVLAFNAGLAQEHPGSASNEVPSATSSPEINSTESTTPQPPTTTLPPPTTSTTADQILIPATKAENRRLHIVEMVKEQWKFYSTKWAEDQGRTIMAAMPSLWLMGLHDEFNKGRNWIQINLDSRIDLERNELAHRTVNNYIGSLLSCYALTGDSMFLNKSTEIAHRLRKSYLPVWDRSDVEAGSPKIALAHKEWAEQVLEYRYLSNLTSDEKYSNRMRVIENFLEANQFPDNEDDLEVYKLDVKVKLFLQSNGSADHRLLEEYKRVITRFEYLQLIRTTPLGYTFVRKRNESSMLNSDCQLGATLTRGAQALELALAQNQTIDDETRKVEETIIAHHRELAEKLTQTCYLATNGTKSGLTPPKFTVTPTNSSAPTLNTAQPEVSNNQTQPQPKSGPKIEGQGEFIFEPHLPESYLILYRKTRKDKYRQWAWTLTKAIYENANLGLGKYKGVQDVQALPTRKRTSKLPPNLFHATMRLIFLTYSDPDTVVPLDRWLISEAGFPLPVLQQSSNSSSNSTANSTL